MISCSPYSYLHVAFSNDISTRARGHEYVSKDITRTADQLKVVLFCHWRAEKEVGVMNIKVHCPTRQELFFACLDS